MKASLQFLQSKSQLAIALKTPGFRQKLAADHMRQRISVKKSTQYYPTRCQVAVIRFDLSIASILTRLSLQRREGPPLLERVFLPNQVRGMPRSGQSAIGVSLQGRVTNGSWTAAGRWGLLSNRRWVPASISQACRYSPHPDSQRPPQQPPSEPDGTPSSGPASGLVSVPGGSLVGAVP